MSSSSSILPSSNNERTEKTPNHPPRKSTTTLVLQTLQTSLSTIGHFLLPECLIVNSPPQVLHETSWLDGLRGVAALLVVLQHEHAMVNMGLHRCYGHDDETRSLAYWPVVRLLFSGGSFAVMVFYYISGFVVPRRMIQMLHEGRQTEYMEALQSAIIRRHVRLLMPAFFSALLIIVFYHITGFEENWSGGRASNIFVEFLWWILDCLHTLNYFTAFAMRYNPVTWTIVVELKGSMAIFAWLFVVHRLRPQRRILLTLALSFFLVLFGLGSWFAAFFVGMLSCELDLLHASGELTHIWFPWTKISHYLAQHKRLHTLVLNAGIFLGMLFASTPMLKGPSAKEAIERCAWPETLFNVVPYHYWQNWPTLEYRDFWYFWGACFLGISIKEVKWAKSLFETNFAQYLGRHSFSLYLTHLVVGATFSRIIFILCGYSHLGGPDANWPFDRIAVGAWHDYFPASVGPQGLTPGIILNLMLTLPVMFFVAEMGTKVFDRPSVRLSRWVWEWYRLL
ncbi:O-acetyltransferase [Sphaerulina musiva]